MREKPKIILFLVIVGAIAGIWYWQHRDVVPPKFLTPKKININFDFLVAPGSQAKPSVFINGEWKELPRSQRNIFSNDCQRMAVCGEGGIYIYHMNKDEIDYIYRKDWYPCREIFFSDDNTLGVLDSKEAMIVNINEKEIIEKCPASEKETLQAFRSPREGTGYCFAITVEERFGFEDPPCTKICNQDRSICARLNSDGGISLIEKKGSTRATNIIDAVAIVGFKENILFFAKCAGTAPCRRLTFMKAAQAAVLNHHLYVYDIEKGIAEKVLNRFRWEYESLVFF